MSGMHLVRGMSSNNSKKRKQKKSPGWKKAQLEHEAFLKKMGVKGTGLRDHRYEIPDYKSTSTVKTSDTICSNGIKKKTVQYTGNEIAGIVVTHKSNLMPIRKDNMQAAKDAAQMRR